MFQFGIPIVLIGCFILCAFAVIDAVDVYRESQLFNMNAQEKNELRRAIAYRFLAFIFFGLIFIIYGSII